MAKAPVLIRLVSFKVGVANRQVFATDINSLARESDLKTDAQTGLAGGPLTGCYIYDIIFDDPRRAERRGAERRGAERSGPQIGKCINFFVSQPIFFK